MKMQLRLAAILLAVAALQPVPSGAGQAPGKAQEAAATPAAPTESEVRARRLLDGAAAFLAAQKEVELRVVASYEVLQKSGQKIEFGEEATIALRRPNELRVDRESSNGAREILLFDGKGITMFDLDHKVYAQSDRAGNVDETIRHFVGDLHMRLPLAPLFLTTLQQELDRRAGGIDDVETTSVAGQLTHHIAGRTRTVDFELWIADGNKPLIQRVALSYRELPGHPRFRADLVDWDLDPDFSDTVFRLELPKDATRIAFAAELAQAAAQAQPAATPASGKGAK